MLFLLFSSSAYGMNWDIAKEAYDDEAEAIVQNTQEDLDSLAQLNLGAEKHLLIELENLIQDFKRQRDAHADNPSRAFRIDLLDQKVGRLLRLADSRKHREDVKLKQLLQEIRNHQQEDRTRQILAHRYALLGACVTVGSIVSRFGLTITRWLLEYESG